MFGLRRSEILLAILGAMAGIAGRYHLAQRRAERKAQNAVATEFDEMGSGERDAVVFYPRADADRKGAFTL
eukprot:CAMPEP_0119290382 /NCGR_PEP_ID=MMETSP1329-20130426/40602_1 /TAXON_ID=114041 /ORGANISM="Genus nov. species nov., Strain RCC1024" /LENGTH=70 /DNA_ID=CAMNT_0007291201 /DNA_START=109 /DNA_END=317 /DNA_ORIENTATION=-